MHDKYCLSLRMCVSCFRHDGLRVVSSYLLVMHLKLKLANINFQRLWLAQAVGCISNWLKKANISAHMPDWRRHRNTYMYMWAISANGFPVHCLIVFFAGMNLKVEFIEN